MCVHASTQLLQLVLVVKVLQCWDKFGSTYCSKEAAGVGLLDQWRVLQKAKWIKSCAKVKSNPTRLSWPSLLRLRCVQCIYHPCWMMQHFKNMITFERACYFIQWCSCGTMWDGMHNVYHNSAPWLTGRNLHQSKPVQKWLVAHTFNEIQCHRTTRAWWPEDGSKRVFMFQR